MAGSGTGERTEKPSGKRIKDAVERGQVARSQNLTAAVTLASVTLVLGWFGVRMVSDVAARLASGLSTLADHAHGDIEATGVATQLVADAGLLVKVAGPPAAIAAVIAIVAGFAQVGWTMSPKALAVNWERLSPASGLAKLKPMQALPELVKSLLSMTVVSWVAYLFVKACFVAAPSLMGMSPVEAASSAWSQLWTLMWRISLALLALGVGDYAWQRFRWFSDLKMTRQEVREEARQNEVNPEIRGRVRKIQRDMARNRMLKAVETATVVITNPTHFAVALEYRRGEMAAPIVVAKGQDHMAARIRTIAREHGVPIVENVTLARALYKAADLGDAIPADLFGAVAEVLAYLVRLKQLML
jgi:flagellar biosynthetic protein FlhB